MGDQGDAGGGGGVAADHDATVERPVACVGPGDVNTIRVPLAPIACWRLADPAFGFDSSFVSTAFSGEIGQLAELVGADDKKGCPAAIFAHADPVGNDDVNKTISDRRAIAIYALLTRQPKMWEDLYARPIDGDTWGTKSIQTMLSGLVDSGGDAYYSGGVDGQYGQGTTDAVRAFQRDNGLAVDGKAGPNTRAKLFAKYMDLVCTPVEPGPDGSPPTPFQMQPSDFLGGGADGGKMTMQGCSRFNPVKLLPNRVMKGKDQDARNAEDAPNRRVLLFLFRKGTNVAPSAWPCPRVKESAAACKAQFWPDGDQRRQNGDTLRRYTDTHDTMACRFYDQFARRSPCEGLRLPSKPLRVAVYVGPDDDPKTIAIAVAGGDTFDAKSATTSGDYLIFQLDPAKMPNPCSLSLKRGDQSEPLGHAFDPTALYGALSAGDLNASDLVFGPISSDSGDVIPSPDAVTGESPA
jgi:hypothetical protein